MIELLPLAIAGLIGVAAGGGLVAYLKSRPTTTKAMALRALAAEAALIAKMPGAADQQALVAQEVQNEALAAKALSDATAKAAGASVA